MSSIGFEDGNNVYSRPVALDAGTARWLWERRPGHAAGKGDRLLLYYENITVKFTQQKRMRKPSHGFGGWTEAAESASGVVAALGGHGEEHEVGGRLVE